MEDTDLSIRSVLMQHADELNHIDDHVLEIRAMMGTKKTSIISCWRGLSDQWIAVIFSCIATAGLRRWAPDFLGDAKSMYNFLHEHIAIYTFQMICTAQGYHHMNPDMSLVNAPAFLTAVYRSFIFAYMRPLVKKEIDQRGRVVSDQRRVQANDRRHAVSISFHFFTRSKYSLPSSKLRVLNSSRPTSFPFDSRTLSMM